jgi:tRNA(Ile2) C34 agmatinyltransferase TiaS
MIAYLWGYDPGQGWRLFGMLCVLLGAITIAAPVVQHLRPTEAESPAIRACPYCGEPVEGNGSAARCRACGRRFRVTEV